MGKLRNPPEKIVPITDEYNRFNGIRLYDEKNHIIGTCYRNSFYDDKLYCKDKKRENIELTSRMERALNKIYRFMKKQHKK